MLAINFYKGEENGIVVEKDNMDVSIFSEQYQKANLLLADLLKNAKDDIPNIVAFCGDRGEGKTSCMTSVREMMKEKVIGAVDKKFYKLTTIDPAFFDEEHNVLQLMLGQMYSDFKKSYNTGKELSKKKEADIEKLASKFQRAKHCLSQLKQPRERIYDPLEDLDALAAAESLKDSISNLIDGFLAYFESDIFVVSIDDIDLNIDGAYEMAEQMRKYMLNKKCIILVSLNVDQLIDVISNSLQKKAAIGNTLGAEEMATKYVAKLIPVGNRVVMPKVYDICNVRLCVYRSHEDRQPLIYNSVKEAVTQLIYLKTRYLFYNSKGGVSPIVPNNLRSLRHLLGMLLEMDDFSDNQFSENNKHAFKAYFFQNWIHQLRKEDQSYASLFATVDDASLLNKMVVSYLSQYFPDDTKRGNTLMANILNSQNYSYNVSVGDVFYVIHHLEKSNVGQELRLMLFFIKSLYGIRLYECYDVITEQKGEMFPEPVDGGEIYKSDAWFKRTNMLQRLLNGAYFTYDSDDLLPSTVEGRMSRDLKLINAMKLTGMVAKELRGEMGRYEQMTAEEKMDFEKRFRITEFFALTAKRPISRRKADQTDRMRRDDAEPFHLSDINLGTGYIVFDVTAPFYNVVNLKYTYERFSYLRGKGQDGGRDLFFDFALKHEWSLLRSMIRMVRLKLYNEEHPNDKRTFETIGDTPENEMDEALHELASNAIIRNGEVLSALTELMQNHRTNMHNKKDNVQLLMQFYGTIIKSDMRTYTNAGTDRPYYLQFVFLEAIIQLLKEQKTDSLLAQVYESGIDSDTTTDDDVVSVFKDFFASNFKTKKRSAIMSDIGKKYPEYASRIASSDWETMFPDSKKSYSRPEIITIFRANFSNITGKVKASDVYIDEDDL